MHARKVAIVGTVGVPANYGGFETLVENIISNNKLNIEYYIFCSGKNYAYKIDRYKNAKLIYINIYPNGPWSILYDICSIIYAYRLGVHTILLLGVSGAIILPVINFFTNIKLITNIDGLEWKRSKWSWIAKCWLIFSEYLAVKFSHIVITDNLALTMYVDQKYHRSAVTIEYGGDIITSLNQNYVPKFPQYSDYSLAICRIEPENNVEMILQAFESLPLIFKLVFIGNWSVNEYSRRLYEKYKGILNIQLIGPIYDTEELNYLRSGAKFYIHGHSAGGTNPSLVEAMHYPVHVLAYDCIFNHVTTEYKADYFSSSRILANKIKHYDGSSNNSTNMTKIAIEKYRWSIIVKKYLDLF